ncbi:MAG: hypothetical protein ABI197_12045 [Granulicella sp.]
MVAAFVAFVLSLVYGLGSLCFLWWDGGLLRRVLIILCALALAAALQHLRHHHGHFHLLHSTVSRGM